MRKRNRGSKNALLALLGMLAVSAGCGGSELSLGKVTGTVTFKDGQPVTEGTVIFQPEKGPSAAGALDAEGRYTLTTQTPGDGAVMGKHRVSVVPPTAGAVLKPGELPTEAPPERTGREIPAKVQNPKTSDLSAEVGPDDNVFDFEL